MAMMVDIMDLMLKGDLLAKRKIIEKYWEHTSKFPPSLISIDKVCYNSLIDAAKKQLARGGGEVRITIHDSILSPR